MNENQNPDLIPIPRKVRIWVDIVLAVAIFAIMVALPLYIMIDLGKVYEEFIWTIATGIFLVLLLTYFVKRARSREGKRK